MWLKLLPEWQSLSFGKKSTNVLSGASHVIQKRPIRAGTIQTGEFNTEEVSLVSAIAFATCVSRLSKNTTKTGGSACWGQHDENFAICWDTLRAFSTKV